MAVGLNESVAVLPVDGIRLGVAKAGIRYPDRDDLALIEVRAGAQCAAVFTRNAFCAAPVILARRHLSEAIPRYLLINAGNANAGTGDEGLSDALICCREVAQLTGVDVEAVLPFSTGVIGERLPAGRIQSGIPGAFSSLRVDGWVAVARAMMTTDTVPKGVSRQFQLAGETVTVTGIAKGSGMIRPDMATMLAFVATDAPVAPALLQQCLIRAAEASFNRITVDGDTSTNDACVLIATGASPVSAIDSADDPAYVGLMDAVDAVCTELAQCIVRDGEGATKFITVTVSEGASEQECLDVAYTIAHSPLVKTACFAGDPNWGRILAAVGRAGIPDLAVEGVRIYLDDVCIVERGGCAAGYSEERGQAVMARDAIAVRVALGRGDQEATVWTTDLSYGYVRINAEYRT